MKELKLDGNQPNRDYLAAGLIALGTLFYTTGFIIANQHKLHPIANALARGIALSLITYAYSRYKNIDLTFPLDSNFKWQLLRNSIIIVQGLCFSWSQFYLPLPIAFTLNASNPLFVAMFDSLIYGVKLNKRQNFWLAVAFLGVVLIINGNQITNRLTGDFYNKSSSFANYLSTDPWMAVIFGSLLALTTCLMGLGVVITKKLKDTNAFQINYFQGIMVLLISALLIPKAFEDKDYHMPNMAEFGWAVLLTGVPTGIGGVLYIFSLTISQNYAIITPFQFTGVLVGYIISIIRYDQELNLICLSGTLSIVIGVVSVIRCKQQP